MLLDVANNIRYAPKFFIMWKFIHNLFTIVKVIDLMHISTVIHMLSTVLVDKLCKFSQLHTIFF